MKLELNINLGSPTISDQLIKAKIKIYDKGLIFQFDNHIEKLDWLLGFNIITSKEHYYFRKRIAKRLEKHLNQFKK